MTWRHKRLWGSSTRTGRRAHSARSVVGPCRGWIERTWSGTRSSHRGICSHPRIPTWLLQWIHSTTQHGAQTSPGSRYHCSTKRMKCGGKRFDQTWHTVQQARSKQPTGFHLAPKTSDGFAQPEQESTWHHGMMWKAECVSQPPKVIVP